MEPKRAASQTFYRWVDSQGRLHVVSSLDDVPVADRPQAAQVTLNGVEAVGHYPPPAGVSAPGGVAWQPEWISFAVGFVAALVLAFLYRVLPGGMRWATRAALVVGVGALITGAYLGLVRRTAGLSGSQALASPSALIQDAKSAVEQMNARQKQQDEELRQLQTDPR